VRLRRRPAATWAARWLRGWRPDRNPLRRGCDRAETAVFGLLVAAFIAAVPFAAIGASTWSHAASVRAERAQQASSRRVRAVLLEAAINFGSYPYGSEMGFEADARWRAPDGQIQTGLVPVPAKARTGSTVMITTDQAGQLAVPWSPSEVAQRADMAGTLAVAALAVTLIVAGALTRWALDRRRLAAWDAEWLAMGPWWSAQR